jgi:hypothetical protein
LQVQGEDQAQAKEREPHNDLDIPSLKPNAAFTDRLQVLAPPHRQEAVLV